MKSIVITGGASGLGLAMAKYWAQKGATICLVDRSTDHQKSAQAEVEAAGGKALFCQCDVTRDEDVTKLKAFTDANMPPVDLLINSAGVPTAGTLTDESLEVWEWVLNINLLGTVRLSKAYGRDFQRRRQGYIVNIASQAGLTSMPLMGSYNATKAAVVAFSETLALELAPFNIGVSVVCPAFVKTRLDESLHQEQQQMQSLVSKLVQGGKITAEEVAEQTAKAIQQKRFMVITHTSGRWFYRLKRFLPEAYLGLMRKRTAEYSARGYQHAES